MKLLQKTSFSLVPTVPFHFDLTFHKPDHFPSNDTAWEPGKRWQTMLWQGVWLGLLFENDGGIEQPEVIVHVFSQESLSPAFLHDLKRELTWRYNLDLDLASFYHNTGENPLLLPIFETLKGLRPMHPGSLYEYLIIAIVLQNALVRRSVSMLQALFEHYGLLLEYDNRQLYAFWLPGVLAQTDEQELRQLKVGYRAKSLIQVSLPYAENSVDELALREAGAKAQERALLSLYGIGPASVGYIMIDVFHNWGYLQHISPWEQKIYTKLFFDRDYETALVPVSEMLAYFEQWGKWKALAVHYIWEHLWWRRQHEHIPWFEQQIRL